MGTTAQLQEAVDVIVQAGAEHLPRVWEAAVDVVKKIPVSKREARERWMTDPKTGQHYTFKHPADLYRNYDEAYINILQMRKQEGFHIPKRQSNGGELDTEVKCMKDSSFGYILGLAYGLQYDRKVQGQCYANIQTSIEALDTIVQLWWLILLPEKTPKVILAF